MFKQNEHFFNMEFSVKCPLTSDVCVHLVLLHEFQDDLPKRGRLEKLFECLSEVNLYVVQNVKVQDYFTLLFHVCKSENSVILLKIYTKQTKIVENFPRFLKNM